jgi:hypothetical protein
MAVGGLSWPRRSGVAKPKPATKPKKARGKNPSGYKLGISDERFWATLQANAGLCAQTAEVLGVEYMTVYKRAKAQQARWDAIVEESREKINDVAEAHFINAVRRGDKDARDKWLRYHAKGRGYVTRIEASGPDGGPIPISAGVDVTIKLVRAAPADEGDEG